MENRTGPHYLQMTLSDNNGEILGPSASPVSSQRKNSWFRQPEMGSALKFNLVPPSSLRWGPLATLANSTGWGLNNKHLLLSSFPAESPFPTGSQMPSSCVLIRVGGPRDLTSPKTPLPKATMLVIRASMRNLGDTNIQPTALCKTQRKRRRREGCHHLTHTAQNPPFQSVQFRVFQILTGRSISTAADPSTFIAPVRNPTSISSHSLVPLLSAPGTTHPLSVSQALLIPDTSHEWSPTAYGFFHSHSTIRARPGCNVCPHVIPFYGQRILHYTAVPRPSVNGILVVSICRLS